jgi:hypothetical protein
MTSLNDVYEGEVGSVAGPRRRMLGRALVAMGAITVLSAVPIATTELGQSVGLSVFEAREFAGVLAGLGLPALFVGIFAVLPASRPARAAASIGASLALFGVVVFVAVYPERWLAAAPALAIGTTLIYGTGGIITFWCLFVSLATLKRRRDPGGTARMRITEEGRLEVIKNTTSRAVGRGAVGLFGTGPDGDVATQTARVDAENDDEAVQETVGGEVLEPEPSADGAGAVPDAAGADAEVIEAVSNRGRPDEYCGNCEHFEYVRADGDITPYCGHNDELMEDMDACEAWAANAEPRSQF